MLEPMGFSRGPVSSITSTSLSTAGRTSSGLPREPPGRLMEVFASGSLRTVTKSRIVWQSGIRIPTVFLFGDIFFGTRLVAGSMKVYDIVELLDMAVSGKEGAK